MFEVSLGEPLGLRQATLNTRLFKAAGSRYQELQERKLARTAARMKGLVGIGRGLPHHQTLFSCSSEPKAQKSRPLREGGGSEVARHPGTCLQGPGPLGCLCCQSREAAPGGGRRIANYARWPKTLRERGWRAGRRRGGVSVPPTLPPASARGISRASVADRTLVLQRLLLDKAPDSRAGGLLQPRKPEAPAS